MSDEKAQHLQALGNSNTQYTYEKPDKAIFETFENTAGTILCPWTFNEFTSMCPMTGQPDWAKIQCLIVPDKKCIESKTFKLYCNAYRNFGEFHEDCVARWLQDVVDTINPHYCRVWAKFNVRGGVSINPMKQFEGAQMKSDPRLQKEIERLIDMYDKNFHWDYV